LFDGHGIVTAAFSFF